MLGQAGGRKNGQTLPSSASGAGGQGRMWLLRMAPRLQVVGMGEEGNPVLQAPPPTWTSRSPNKRTQDTQEEGDGGALLPRNCINREFASVEAN